jgi:thioredoxin-related protein
MKVFHLIISLFVSSVVFSGGKGIQFEEISLDEAKKKAIKENKIIFIDYYADWCGPCKWLAKNVFTDKEIGTLFNENFINLKIDADIDNFIGREYQASSLPTLLFIDGTGELKKKIVGAVDKIILTNNANYVLYPETDPLTLKQKKFNNGERDKEFMYDFALMLSENQKDLKFLSDAYILEYPKLNLDDDIDFIFFYLGSIKDNGASLIKEFMDDFNTYYIQNDKKNQSLEKLIDIYVAKLEQAAEDKNDRARDEIIKELVNFVEKNKIKEIEPKKLEDLLNQLYKEKKG